MDSAAGRRSDLRDRLRLRTPPCGVVARVDESVAQGTFERRRVTQPTRDGDESVRLAASAYEAPGRRTALGHARCEGDHAVTRERFDRIVDWVAAAAGAAA